MLKKRMSVWLIPNTIFDGTRKGADLSNDLDVASMGVKT